MTKQQHQHQARYEALKQQWLRSHPKASAAEFERAMFALRWVCARQ